MSLIPGSESLVPGGVQAKLGFKGAQVEELNSHLLANEHYGARGGARGSVQRTEREWGVAALRADGHRNNCLTER